MTERDRKLSLQKNSRERERERGERKRERLERAKMNLIGGKKEQEWAGLVFLKRLPHLCIDEAVIGPWAG